jgi:hypothetical protein
MIGLRMYATWALVRICWCVTKLVGGSLPIEAQNPALGQQWPGAFCCV